MKTNSSIFKVLQGGKMMKYGYIALLLIVGVTMAATQVHAAKIAFSDNAAKITAMTMAVPDNAASVTTDCTTITTTKKWVRSTTATGRSQETTTITTDAAKKTTLMDVAKPKVNLLNAKIDAVNCTVDLVTCDSSPQAIAATSKVIDISTPAATAKTELIFQYNLIGVAMTKMAPVKMAGKVDFLKEGNEDAVVFSSSTTG